MSRTDLAKEFETVFHKLLARERVDLYAEDVSPMWEVIAEALFGALPERKGCYFDGVSNLDARIRKQRQVEFTGDMWIGKDGPQWTEPFKAIVTDKTITKQGIWVVVTIGANKAEAELWSAFGVTRSAEHSRTMNRELCKGEHCRPPLLSLDTTDCTKATGTR